MENSFDGTSYQIVKALLENGLFFPRKWNFAAVSHSDSKWCKAVHIIQIDAIASVNLYKWRIWKNRNHIFHWILYLQCGCICKWKIMCRFRLSKYMTSFIEIIFWVEPHIIAAFCGRISSRASLTTLWNIVIVIGLHRNRKAIPYPRTAYCSAFVVKLLQDEENILLK